MNKETHDAILAVSQMVIEHDGNELVVDILAKFNVLLESISLVDGCELCDDSGPRWPDRFHKGWAFYCCYKCGFEYRCGWAA